MFTLQESKTRLNISFRSQRQEFAGGFFIRFLMYVISNALGQGNSIRLTIFHAINHLCPSDDYLHFRSNSVRLVLASWVLTNIVVINSYSSQLVSFLTLPVFEKPINSFEELAQRPDVPLAIAADSVLLQTLYASLLPIFSSFKFNKTLYFRMPNLVPIKR